MTSWILLVGIPLLVCAGCGSLSRTFMNASWRDRWQHPEVVVHSLALRPGNQVADLGAGGGYFTFRLADAVGPTGKVYAVEIDANFFPHIQRKVKEQDVSNVRTVLGKPGDPTLPAADVDVAFLHDVLHHVEDKQGYLRQVVRYLTPAARLAIVEFNPATSPHKDDPRLQVTKSEMTAWMAALGFAPAEDVSLFADKWYVVYARKQ